MKPWEAPITFWRAEYHTRHFQFEAFGNSRDGALRAMRVLLLEHEKQYRLDLERAPSETSWADEAFNELTADDMVRELQMGAGYRDGEKVSEE